MKYDSIILDIDGTIWNTTEIVADAWNKAIETSNYKVQHVDAEQLKKEFGKPMNIIGMDLWPELSQNDQDKLLDLCCKMEHIYIEQNTKDITFPDVIETVKSLSEKIDFYIVSNCQSGYIELMMHKTGLTPYIKDFECFGNTGFSKGKNITYICNRNNLKNPVYVGDTHGDEEACLEAGIDFIFAEYGFGTASKFQGKIDSFAKIISLIE